MKKSLLTSFLSLIIFLFIFINGNSFSKEKSNQEQKIGVFLEDLKSIGKFQKIENAPIGMFEDKYDTFNARAKYSLEQIGKIFVKQKGLLDKYPNRMMKGMAYFEFFYQQQLKENKRIIVRFERNYPPKDAALIKTMKKLYSLNKARKSMREALGLSLDDDIEKTLLTYNTMNKLFVQSVSSRNKLTKDEKILNKLHEEIAKLTGKAKNIVEQRNENRLTKEKFLKEYVKAHNKLEKSIKKANFKKEYKLLYSLVEEIYKFDKDNTSAILSGYKLTEFILKDLKSSVLKKNFSQDLSKANFDVFKNKELTILGEVTKNNKNKKNNRSNEIQVEILNLENNNLPVSKLLDVYRDELGVKLETIHLQLASQEIMAKWAQSDWANAWKSKIPTKIKDSSGIEVNLSNEQIESIKAQLALQNFQEIIQIDQFKDLVELNSEFDNIKSVINESTNFSFSYTLDDWAQAWGDIYDIDLNNYADLTALANAQHGANWSVEEYASAYQAEVDIINALQTGDLSSFDAASLAQDLGASLQEVADTISAASAAGIATDLEAAAAGLGFDSFADAVAAYNQQYGTNYTVEQAKEALGQ